MVAFVQHTLNLTFRNPNFENVKKIVGLFDQSFSANLGNGLHERDKAALTSIVREKNHLAHGDNPQLSLGDLSGYYIRARRVVQAVEAILL